MEFISEAGQTSINEPRKEQLSEQEHLTSYSYLEDFPIKLQGILFPFESEDDDLALFGVGGPA